MSELYNQSRYSSRDRRRKANVVLNILIGTVIVLILVVGSQLIRSGGDEQTSSNSEANPSTSDGSGETNEEAAVQPGDDEEAEEGDAAETAGEDSSQEEEETVEEAEGDPLAEATVTDGDPNSDVDKVIENPSWQPVGTEQSGPHTAVYEKNSQDWAEMTRAISYATGIPEDNMTIWFLGNNGTPNDARGTVSPKNNAGEKYRVAITFVEGEGWMPVTVEKLRQ
ncbi:DUF1510 family protein [Bacillus lacus]|uniref:DUF1510 family protein n=1 Tax=Metabacillus lacus TaxID=1983721 RepID=A0A7X2IX20_9BACI|nr:YrrS family protein [Metabacillus lacus]MRX71355.1 DUF1510 family protein [Metabacillus lacus]